MYPVWDGGPDPRPKWPDTAPPTPIVIYPVYGNFCGPQTGPGPYKPTDTAIDPLDSCCKQHDRCWAQHKCTFPKGSWIIPWGHCHDCNVTLATCMSKVNCSAPGTLNILGCSLLKSYVICGNSFIDDPELCGDRTAGQRACENW
jgi:hypothetical protein